jgi:hypothetical protein
MDMKRRLLALILGIIFGVYITPKEIFHAFQNHTDSQHQSQSGLHLESAHHHCFLSKVDQALCSIEPPTFLFVPNPSIVYQLPKYEVKYIDKPLQGCFQVIKGRGPPSAFFLV